MCARTISPKTETLSLLDQIADIDAVIGQLHDDQANNPRLHLSLEMSISELRQARRELVEELEQQEQVNG